MRVAILNTQTYGGAGIVALRLHRALTEMGISSHLVTKYGVPGISKDHKYLYDGTLRNRARELLLKPLLSPVSWLAKRLDGNRLERSAGFEIFSRMLKRGNSRLRSMLRDYDVLHLNWIVGLADYETFFQEFSDKKFVWTLHDMNPFTGGCHHSDGCMHFTQTCVNCPQLEGRRTNYSVSIQKQKIEALRGISPNQMVFTAPSMWIQKQAEMSSVIGPFKVLHVPNPVFYVPPGQLSKQELRRNLGLPIQKKILLFVAENIMNPRKGIRSLLEAVRGMPENRHMHLLGIGHKGPQISNLSITYTGSLSDQNLLIKYYKAADLFATTTLAENSPLTVIESLACGTPVCATAVGGIPELVNNRNGVLIHNLTKNNISDAIRRGLFETTYNSSAISAETQRLHNPHSVAKAFNSIYKGLLS
jgi:glycosyltransferase involved in cell wall biosynthesis